MALSHHPSLPYLAFFFATIFLAIGTTYIVSPRAGYAMYGFSSSPSTALDWAVMERVMVLYGVKDIFIAAAIYASTWFGTRRSAGLVMAAAGACAGVDGWVVRREAGTGEWNHWGYGGVMGLVGLVMAGVVG